MLRSISGRYQFPFEFHLVVIVVVVVIVVLVPNCKHLHLVTQVKILNKFLKKLKKALKIKF